MPNDPPTSKIFQDMITDLNRIGGEPRCSALLIHLYVEYIVDWILKKKIPDSENMVITFAKKLDVLDKLKILPDDIINDLIMISWIRNMYAHELDITSPEFEREFLMYVNKIKVFRSKFPSEANAGARLALVAGPLIETLREQYEKL